MKAVHLELTLHRVRLAQDAERRLVVHVPAAHLLLVGEWREEQRRWRLTGREVGHVWWGGGECGEALSVREEFGVRDRGCKEDDRASISQRKFADKWGT